MNRLLQAAMMTMLVSMIVLGVALGQAPTATSDDETTTGNLTSEQDNAIYAALTQGIVERDVPALRIGDELPSGAQVRTLPDSLELTSVKGLLYAVIPAHTAEGFHNEVLLVDPATSKVVRIIRRPLGFHF